MWKARALHSSFALRKESWSDFLSSQLSSFELKVDVIVTLYVPPSLAAKQATQDIPIVVIVGDPVETGIVPSLAHPGGNITGVSLMASALGGGKLSNCSAI